MAWHEGRALLDFLSSKLGIDSSDFQVQDNGTCLVLKAGNITYNFYTRANTLQIQGKENAEQLKLNLIDLAKQKLPEKARSKVTKKSTNLNPLS